MEKIKRKTHGSEVTKEREMHLRLRLHNNERETLKHQITYHV